MVPRSCTGRGRAGGIGRDATESDPASASVLPSAPVLVRVLAPKAIPLPIPASTLARRAPNPAGEATALPVSASVTLLLHMGGSACWFVFCSHTPARSPAPSAASTARHRHIRDSPSTADAGPPCPGPAEDGSCPHGTHSGDQPDLVRRLHRRHRRRPGALPTGCRRPSAGRCDPPGRPPGHLLLAGLARRRGAALPPRRTRAGGRRCHRLRLRSGD